MRADEVSTATVEVESAVDTFATRRVLFGTISDAAGSLASRIGDRVMIEEKEGDSDAASNIPPELSVLFRTALATGSHGEHTVQIFEDTGAMTIEDLADIAAGELTYRQIKDIFTATLDAVNEAHQAGYLVLAIAPWTIRIEGGSFSQSPQESSELDVNGTNEDETIEAMRPDAATLEAATRAAEEEVLRALAETVGPDRHKKPAEPSQNEPNSDAHVDDAWDELDDSDVFANTGLLPAPPAPEPARAFFEGIDELLPSDEDPYEVPVIMGFSPPELLGRVRADVGEHCDIFALGMLLYYLIAGRVPPASVYTRYTPAVPSRNFRPGFPPGLQPIISRATRPAPGERYGNVAAMRDAFLSACALMERRAQNIGGTSAPRTVLSVDTHVGIAKRRRNPTNQDSVFGKVTEDGRFALIVVADGVSTASYGSGDLASNYLTQTAAEVWADVLPRYLMDERIDEVEVIGQILDRANEHIVNYVNSTFQPFEGNPHEVMGTTSLIAIIRDGIATVASLGDSRVYVQTTAGLEQVTADHNLWTLSVLDGISADAALSMPHGDALARCLGTFVIDGKRLEAVPPEADYFRFALTRGDTLLLTTDGLIDFAGANPFSSEENVLAVMLAEPDPSLACLELILLANRGGGGDNIGVGIVHMV